MTQTQAAAAPTEVITYNPLDPAVTHNPYPHYAQLRALAPVHWLPQIDRKSVV